MVPSSTMTDFCSILRQATQSIQHYLSWMDLTDLSFLHGTNAETLRNMLAETAANFESIKQTHQVRGLPPTCPYFHRTRNLATNCVTCARRRDALEKQERGIKEVQRILYNVQQTMDSLKEMSRKQQ